MKVSVAFKYEISHISLHRQFKMRRDHKSLYVEHKKNPVQCYFQKILLEYFLKLNSSSLLLTSHKAKSTVPVLYLMHSLFIIYPHTTSFNSLRTAVLN